jgi:hypothetical protein
MDPISMGEGSREAMKEGGQGAALPHDAHAAAACAPHCSSPPSSPLSLSPTPPIMQWFILPHTSVPSYVNMVIDLLNVFGLLELYVDMVLSFGVYYIYARMD